MKVMDQYAVNRKKEEVTGFPACIRYGLGNLEFQFDSDTVIASRSVNRCNVIAWFDSLSSFAPGYLLGVPNFQVGNGLASN